MKARDALIYAGAGFGLFVAFRVYQKGISGSVSDLAGAAIDAAGEVFSGAVLGIGDAVGLPRTNSQAGADAWARGDYMEASKLLPAGEFIGAVWDSLTSSDAPAVDPALERAQRNAQLYGGSVSGWLVYEYIDNDPINLRGSGIPTASKWGTQTTAGWPWER